MTCAEWIQHLHPQWPTTYFDDREVILIANKEFHEIAKQVWLKSGALTLTDVMHIDLQSTLKKAGEEGASANTSKVGLFRKQPCSAAITDPAQGLPFFGKVCSEEVAMTLPKHTTLPLGDNAGEGPSLYLDGSASLNIMRPGHCIAWHCRRVKASKPDQVEADVAAAEAEADIGTPAKRKRLSKGQHVGDSAARTKKDDKDNVPTHEIKWLPLIIEIGDPEESGRVYHYERPVLVEIADANAMSITGEVHRSLIPFDDQDPVKDAKRRN